MRSSVRRPIFESRIKVTTLTVFAMLLASGGGVRAAEGLEWPREYEDPRGKLVLYQPQVTKWDEFSRIEARMALAFALAGEDAPSLGSVELVADTETDLDSHQVRLTNIRIDKGRFPSLDATKSQKLIREVEGLFPDEAVVALERIVANLERGRRDTQEVELKVDPPVIFSSVEPAILVLLDGEPLMSPIRDSDLRFAVNTNWDLFELAGTFYLRNEDAWLMAPDLGGPWSPAGKLPKPFKKLPKKEGNWKDVRDNLPGRKITLDEVPHVYVSETPAELILIEGEPRFSKIENTRLLWVDNSESDLFRSDADSHFYYLVSGRWFRAQGLDGPWSFAGKDLPDDFAEIPTDHPRAHVRASVPGTPEAEEAALLAQIPQKATVERGSLKPQVAYNGEPEFKPIEGTSMHYAVNTSHDVIRVGDLYYLCFQAVWFVSSTPNGPWEVADKIPDEVYTIPPSSPVYHTTHVQVYDHTPTHVVVGYTSGYWGVYYSYGSVYYGTGWYYPPYYYWGGYYPVYYPYPYSYGVSAYYNPHTGTYGRGVWGYGPYGGWGYGARYNPTTGTYARGGAAYGPYAYRGWAEAYNPRTGAYARTRQGGNAYSHWGTTGIQRGDDWVRTAHYAGSEGGFAGYRTSEGGGGFVARNENNLYAGRDGNVYRRNEDGWQQYNDGNWDSVERPEGASPEARADRRAGEAAPDRSTRDAAVEAGAPGIGERDRQASRPDRSTMDQLDRDARSRSRGSTSAQNSRSWRSSPSAGSFGRSGFGGRAGGRRGRR